MGLLAFIKLVVNIILILVQIICHRILLPELIIAMSALDILVFGLIMLLDATSSMRYEQPHNPGLFIFGPLDIIAAIILIVMDIVGMRNS